MDRRVKLFLKDLAHKILLVVISLLWALAFSEFIIFRIVVPATDMPRNQFINEIIKYIPNQKGIFRKDDYQTDYNINANGWNSRYPEYDIPRTNKYRIAIIGDSYVEALMVDYRKSLAEQLEDQLSSDRFEVYRFGISGAPLSQYLHILRREVTKFSPELAVIVLVHNDFDESYKYMPGRYTSSFLKIKINEGKVVGEIPPHQYQESLTEYLLRKSAIFRYFIYNKGTNIDYFKNLLSGKNNKEMYQANIDIANLKQQQKNNELVTDYLLKEIKRESLQHKINILMVMDGDRNNIYKGNNSKILYENGVLSLNKMAKRIASKYDIPFIDLQPIFQQDYQKNRTRFDYVHDGHWNEYGHKIVADTIFNYLTKQNDVRF